MRDPNRIPVVLAALETYWRAHPDLRLCQIVVNLSGRVDPFYVEDEILLAAITPAVKVQT